MLDSNCSHVGGCGRDSEQGRWLAQELAASDDDCMLAIFHHPRFSSGMHGGDHDVAAFWDVLHAAGADVVINAHDHDYERFAPQRPDGTRDDANGIRQFVVGTGGGGLRPFEDTVANSEVRNADTHGVLAVTLGDGDYSWEFVPVAGRTFTDTGSGTCH